MDLDYAWQACMEFFFFFFFLHFKVPIHFRCLEEHCDTVVLCSSRNVNWTTKPTFPSVWGFIYNNPLAPALSLKNPEHIIAQVWNCWTREASSYVHRRRQVHISHLRMLNIRTGLASICVVMNHHESRRPASLKSEFFNLGQAQTFHCWNANKTTWSGSTK